MVSLWVIVPEQATVVDIFTDYNNDVLDSGSSLPDQFPNILHGELVDLAFIIL